MKKIVLAVALALLFGFNAAAQSQPYKFLENTYFSVGGGVNFYGNDNISMFSNMGFQGEATVGKWVSNCIGFRIGGTMIMSANMYSKPTDGLIPEQLADSLFMASRPKDLYGTTYLTGDFAISIDPFHMNKKVFDPSRPRGYFMVGLGFVYRATQINGGSDFDFLYWGGYHQDFLRFGSGKPFSGMFFIEPRYMGFTNKFDDNESASGILFATLGMKFNFNPVLKPWMFMPKHAEQTSKFWHEDWYVGAGIGYNSLHYNGYENTERRLRLFRPVGQLTLGKYVSPYTSVRLQTEVGGLGIEDNSQKLDLRNTTITYNYTHADVALNLSNTGRRFMNKAVKSSVRSTFCSSHMGASNFWGSSNVEIFAGCGIETRLSDLKLLMAADAGLRCRFVCSKNSDVYLEYRYTQHLPRVASGISTSYRRVENGVTTDYSQGRLSLFSHTLAFGYNYNFGTPSYK